MNSIYFWLKVKQRGRNYPVAAKKLDDGLQKYLISPFTRGKLPDIKFYKVSKVLL